MSSRARYVFDTNVIISALLFAESPPGQALYWALEKGEVLLSGAVIEELNEVLSRERFERYLRLDERELFLDALIRETTLIEITQRVSACRDSKDDKFLELAVSGDASFIISGDDDLLVLNPFQGIQILSPAQFLALVSQEKGGV